MLKKSPFEAVHRQLDARFGEYAGWSLPADYGDPQTEARAIAEHCALVDLSSFGRLYLQGRHASLAPLCNGGEHHLVALFGLPTHQGVAQDVVPPMADVEIA